MTYHSRGMEVALATAAVSGDSSPGNIHCTSIGQHSVLATFSTPGTDALREIAVPLIKVDNATGIKCHLLGVLATSLYCHDGIILPHLFSRWRGRGDWLAPNLSGGEI